MTYTQDTRTPNLTVEDPDARDWILIHPEVLQYAPDWATHAAAHFETDGSVGIGFDGNYGTVQISTSVIWKAGQIEIPDNGFTGVFFRENEGPVDVETLNAYVRDFTVAAEAFAKAFEG